MRALLPNKHLVTYQEDCRVRYKKHGRAEPLVPPGFAGPPPPQSSSSSNLDGLCAIPEPARYSAHPGNSFGWLACATSAADWPLCWLGGKQVFGSNVVGPGGGNQERIRGCNNGT